MSMNTQNMDIQAQREKRLKMQQALASIVGSYEGPCPCPDNTVLQDLLDEKPGSISAASAKDLEICFNELDQKMKEDRETLEYSTIENFISEEEDLGTQRRKQARQVEASEEKRMATDVALLKGFQSKYTIDTAAKDLERRLMDAERAYTNRKMVLAESAQTANGEFRLQHARVREFFQTVNQKRLQAIEAQRDRTIRFQSILHRLRGTDRRIVALEEQITRRLFEKKKSHLNELHMSRTIEENAYLEKVLDMLDKIQKTKHNAAKEVFQLRVKGLREQQQEDTRRQEELDLFAASATIETANVLALYTEEDGLEIEKDRQLNEKVQRMERRKHFQGSDRDTTTSLYDNVLWSAASSSLGLFSSSTTCTSSVYSLDFGADYAYDIADATHDDDNNDNGKDSSNMNTIDQRNRLSPAGKMNVKQVAKRLRAREMAMLERHEEERRLERRQQRKLIKALVKRHQITIEKMLEDYFLKQQNLREDISNQIDAFAKRQHEEAEQLRLEDIKHMREAIAAEDQRVAEAEGIFARAHELISTQVFHEVRNALSSVVAMREMTNTQRSDSSLSPSEVVVFLDDMMEQTQDVVDYSLKTLNNVLDMSKMRSGAFQAKKEPFDVQDVLVRTTRMQKAKIGRGNVKMRFTRSNEPIIALSDASIVERIIATLISNAVKFTPTGAIQPFICPLDALQPELLDECVSLGDKTMTLMAVGVADTGVSLSKEDFRSAESKMIASHSLDNSYHGAQNTGFGLHHAHLQAKALGSRLQLTSLENCSDFLDEDIRINMKLCNRKHNGSNNLSGHKHKLDAEQPSCSTSPCSGTVIYLAIPVYRREISKCMKLVNHESTNIPHKLSYPISQQVKFCPRPTPEASNGHFRILVADDVMMLRKGVVHTIGSIWKKKYPQCPVSISTACTAEDVIRAARSQPYDMIFCDHLFDFDPSKITKLTPEEVAAKKRPAIVFNDETLATQREGDLMRQKASTFFKNERFSTQDCDGALKGLEALEMMANQKAGLPFPTPVLVLLSGHSLEVDPRLGIIVAQKPVKLSEFIPMLEAHAAQLVKFGRCTEQPEKKEVCSESGSGRIVNARGSQMFIHEKLADRDASIDTFTN